MTKLNEEELLEEFEEMWKSAVIGSTWKLNKGARQAYQQIRMLIQKPGVDEDIVNRYKVLFHDASTSMIEQLIRKLIKESQGKRATVDMDFINKWVLQIVYLPITKTLRGQLKKMLIEAGVEVNDD